MTDKEKLDKIKELVSAAIISSEEVIHEIEEEGADCEEYEYDLAANEGRLNLAYEVQDILLK